MNSLTVRQRAKHSKTRTGCYTCRARHVKCDEQRPACLRCLRARRECLGYRPPKSAAPKVHSVVLPRAATICKTNAEYEELYDRAHALAAPVSPAPLVSSMTVTERLALDLFFAKTVHRLPGSAWSLQWMRLAQRIGLHDPATLHAAAALGSLHQVYGTADYRFLDNTRHDDDSLHIFALSQCNKAMAHMRQHMERGLSSSNVEVIMLASLLLFCFEVWRARDSRAGTHLRSGLRLLYEHVSSLYSDIRTGTDGKRLVTLQVQPRDTLDLLLQTFVRLDQDLTITTTEGPYLHPIVSKEIPNSFFSLDEAMVHMDALNASIQAVDKRLTTAGLEFIAEHRPNEFEVLNDAMLQCLATSLGRVAPLGAYPGLAEEIEEVRHNIWKFTNALNTLSVTSESEAAHLLLQICAFALCYEATCLLEVDEMYADNFEDQFRRIISLAERYADLHREDSSIAWSLGSTANPNFDLAYETAPRPAFSVGTPFVQCICLVAFKCRTTSLRQRCVRLLSSIDLQGVFDTGFVVSLVQTLIDLEESRARSISELDSTIKDLECHQVPAEARTLDMNLAPSHTESLASPYYKAGRGSLVYTVCEANGLIRVHQKSFSIPRKCHNDSSSQSSSKFTNEKHQGHIAAR